MIIKRQDWFKLAWTITLIPSISLGLFYSFVLRARWVLGRWPIPYQPDPKDLEFGFHHFLVWLSIPVTYLSAATMIGLFILMIFSIKIQKFNYRLAGVIFASSFMVWWIGFYSDPGQFWEWFMD